MSVEDRLRTAARARANLVTAIRPLELPAREPIRLRPAPGPRRWVAWAAPAAAAALVVGLAVTLVSIRQAGHQSSAPSVAAGQSGGSVTSFAGVPKYYAALYDPSATAFNDETTAQPVELVVGQTGSSQRLATVTPPSGQSFVGVTAEESDTAFIVAAEPFPVRAGMNSLPAVAWYVVRIAPGHGQGATVTKLPIPGEPSGSQVDGVAVSPDGTKLAIMYQPDVWIGNPNQGELTLSIYSVATGQALRTWTQQTKGFPAGYGWYWGRYANSSMTWLSDGHTLAFDDGINNGEDGPPAGATFGGVKLRTINTDRPSGDLLAGSKVVYTPASFHACDMMQLTANGKTVVCGYYEGDFAKRSSAFDPKITEYSLATGRPTLVYRYPGSFNLGFADVLWMNADGSTIVGSAWTQDGVTVNHQFKNPSVPYTAAGLITKNGIKPMTFPLNSTPFIGMIAF
jgi:hypothetical protein